MRENEELFGRALQSPSALLDGISLEEGRTPVFLPYGSSAELRSRVILTSDITAMEKLRDRTVSLVAEEGQRVDVIALCGSRAVIVSPGCGLLCVDATDLLDWKTRSSPLLGVSRSSIVSELMSSTAAASNIAKYLEFVGSDLRQLCTGSIQSNDGEAFQQILRKCPRLETLIVSSLGVIEPLLAAYETGNCSSLSTLKIGSISNPALYLLLHSLGDPATSAARHVRCLSIGLPDVSEDDARAIASVLTRNRRLTYLRLDGRLVRDGDESILDCLSELVDQPVVQTHESRHAVYVFLLASRRHRVLRSLPQPCAQVIAEFAATPSRRHVSWDVTS